MKNKIWIIASLILIVCAILIWLIVLYLWVPRNINENQQCSDNSDCIGFVDDYIYGFPGCVHKDFPTLAECERCKIVEDFKCECNLSISRCVPKNN